MFKLNHDILWEIFSGLIADVEDGRRLSSLTTLRHLSQVCSIWRDLVLSFSTLWGMAVDLGKLTQKTDHWRAEILRRTGGSLLDIRGDLDVIHHSDRLHMFLMVLLYGHWSRIRSLDIEFRANQSFAEEVMWHAFQRPSPHLEYFSVGFRTSPTRFWSNQFEIFAGHSPLLRHFKGLEFHVNPAAFWPSNLRSLRLTCQFTAPEFLEVLSRMPLLEILDVFTEGDEIDGPGVERSPLPQVLLPRLEEFSIDARPFMMYLTILDHIVPEPLKTFSFLHCPVRLSPLHSEIAQRVLPDYLRRFYEEESPDDLDLLIGRKFFTVLTGSFTFGIDPSDGFPDSSILLSSIHSIPLEHITRLTLYITQGTILPANVALTRTISLLSSVELLTINPYVLELLLSLPTTPSNIPLPFLKTLVLSDFDDLKPESLFTFLAERIKLNASVDVLRLDLTPDAMEHSSWLTCDNFDFLEELDGLKVIWGDANEYVCGGGDAKVLDFTANS